MPMIILISLMSFSCGNREEHMAKLKETVQLEIETSMAQKADALKETVRNFYSSLSTAPNEDTAKGVALWMDNQWESTPMPAGGPYLEGFVKTLHMFHGMIPDLQWDVQEMLVDGNKVIVRSMASGTPNSPEGYFFGTPTEGVKRFEVMTIDIHTVEDGKITKSFHVEDWLTAVQQVNANE